VLRPSPGQAAPDCGLRHVVAALIAAPKKRSGRVSWGQSGVPAHTDGMPVRLHYIVVDAHDLPGLARFWTQALGWKVLSEREREIVIGTDQNAPVGMCFMPVTGAKIVKNRVHLDLTTSAEDRDREIGGAFSRSVPAGSTSGRPARSPGPSWPTRKETSSAWYARRKRSSGKARCSSAETDPVGGMRVHAVGGLFNRIGWRV
jgi:hypothetical protein